MKILITGFSAFLTHKENPSEMLTKELTDSSLETLILPVSYYKAKDLLISTIKEKQPDLILSFGLASGRDSITIEKYAYNEMKASVADEDGVKMTGQPVSFFLRDRLETSLSLEPLVKELKKRGHSVKISTDPGRFCCNEVYYLALRSGLPCLFIHLPELEKTSLDEDVSFAKDLIALLKR
jgi:pyroglutamyl-peptidase